MSLPYYAIKFKKSGAWLALDTAMENGEHMFSITEDWMSRFPLMDKEEALAWAKSLPKQMPRAWRKQHGKMVVVKVTRYVKPKVPKFIPWEDQIKAAMDVFIKSGIQGRTSNFEEEVRFEPNMTRVGLNKVPETLYASIHVGQIISGGVHMMPSREIAFTPLTTFVDGSAEVAKKMAEEMVAYLTESGTVWERLMDPNP